MYEDDKLARNVKNVESEKNSSGLRLMKLIEQMQQREWNPYKVDRYIEVVLFFIILTFIVIYFQIDTRHNEHGNGYHKEILPSTSLSYIKYGQPVPLADGNYPIAMPSQDSTIKINGQEVFPMLLILVPEIKDGQIADFNLYPLNIADDSILPRQGRTLALHILFGFTNEHAENTLVYDEKISDSAADDYKRKAFYYLVVKDGYGKMQRGYMTKEAAGDTFKYYRDVDHVKDELISIYHITNN